MKTVKFWINYGNDYAEQFAVNVPDEWEEVDFINEFYNGNVYDYDVVVIDSWYSDGELDESMIEMD